MHRYRKQKDTMNHTAYFNRFTLELPDAAVADCSHQGPCDEDVAHWSPRIERPAEITADALAAELKEYGAWEPEDLADDLANWHRLIWLAAGNIKDELHVS